MAINYFRATLFLVSIVIMYVNFAPDTFPLIRQRRYMSYSLPTQCVQDGQFAFTFDEGPTTYTDAVLGALAQLNGKATFHIATNMLDATTTPYLKKAYAAGHLIGLRYPPNLDPREQTDSEFVNTLYTESNKIYAAIGVYPMFIRLPYAQWEDRTIFLTQRMDMVPVQWNIDTQDYTITGTNAIDQVINFVQQTVASSTSKSFISLHRDLYSMYGDKSKDIQLLSIATKNGMTLVDLGSCLNTPQKYRVVNRNFLQVTLNVTLTRGAAEASSTSTGTAVSFEPKSTDAQQTSSSINSPKPNWYVVLAWILMLVSCM